MATTYLETVLPSGKGLRIEKLKTKAFRQAQQRAFSQYGDNSTALTMALGNELLVSAFRAITPYCLSWQWVKDKEGKDTVVPDVDAMLSAVKEEQWLRPTYEQLVSEGDSSLDSLLDDPADYTAALRLVQSAVLPDPARSTSLAGKTRMVSVER